MLATRRVFSWLCQTRNRCNGAARAQRGKTRVYVSCLCKMLCRWRSVLKRTLTVQPYNWRHQCLGFSFAYRIERRWKSAQSGVANWLYKWLESLKLSLALQLAKFRN
nr:MAG TPA: hypothetical protein [Caudoviricetes sp.]